MNHTLINQTVTFANKGFQINTLPIKITVKLGIIAIIQINTDMPHKVYIN